ncbi:MAG: ZIP family metal transporter [Phycisphaerales bacterium]
MFTTATILLIVYCLLIVLASVAGGLLPLYVKLTHQRMQLALSFAAGVMAGMALLHLLPHAWLELSRSGADASMDDVALALLAGFLVIFLLERFFCFHHHEDPHGPGNGAACNHTKSTPSQIAQSQPAQSGSRHALSWSGATIGLTVHSLIAGAALAASIRSELGHGSTNDGAMALAGFATFLIIVLHQPFDSLTIGALMAAGDPESKARPRRHLINALFALVVPLGALLFLAGVASSSDSQSIIIGLTLAFSAGMFLCIAFSDLLPELQFHPHDRIKLTLALLAGLLIAWGVARIEHRFHDHSSGDGHDHAQVEYDTASHKT